MPSKYRGLTQTLFFVAALVLGFLVGYNIIVPAHNVCPYALVCYGVAALSNNFPLLFIPAVITGAAIAVASMFVGRLFCGWICPFGTLQEWLYRLRGKRLNNRHFKLPSLLHKILGLLKYGVLAFTVTSAYFLAQYLYMGWCPVLNLTGITYIAATGIVSLSIFVVGGLLIERFFCRYLCPYGALMNVMQFIGKLLHLPRRKVARNMETCRDCTLCSACCPMQLDIDTVEQVTDPNCLQCDRCLKRCPARGCLCHSWQGK